MSMQIRIALISIQWLLSLLVVPFSGGGLRLGGRVRLFVRSQVRVACGSITVADGFAGCRSHATPDPLAEI
jgi:hypothetical protein